MSQSRPATHFWRDAVAIRESITPHVLPEILAFGVIATVIILVARVVERWFGIEIALEATPIEIAGAALSLLLVLRTNAGYQRWWEGRVLWGGIVNQSRNLVISALTYGPADPDWRRRLVMWVKAFPQVACTTLRGESPPETLQEELGSADYQRLSSSVHAPSYVAARIGEVLREALDQDKIDSHAFMQMERQRMLLIDHIGGCERIMKTPLPRIYSIKIRRLISLFLLTLPFAMLHDLANTWLIPFLTIMVAYPLLALDQIGIELQNPFSTQNLSHLPLDEISATIDKNLTRFLEESVR